MSSDLTPDQTPRANLSSAEPPVIRVRGMGKSYQISHQPNASAFTLAEAAMKIIRKPLGRFGGNRETFWALRDFELDVFEGEVLGIIGRNGAGKSTLLKVLSRITRPTVGHFELRGRVGSLLEVGTGFHPELTGRENIFLNGTILGMTRGEVRANFDAIVDFSGIERFLDTPVKRYSSGMYVRLAFAVAAHLEPEILIVDEVLAVGDAEFQKKCLGKMRDVASGGRTVLFVSHNMAAVQNLCSRCVWVAGGRMAADGKPDEVIEAYNRTGQADTVAQQDLRNLRREKGKHPVLRAITLLDDRLRPTAAVAAGQAMSVRIDFEATAPLERPFFGITLENPLGVKVLWLNTNLNGPPLPDLPARGSVTCRLPRLMLVPGVYRLSIGCGTGSTQLDHLHAAASVQVLEADVFGTGRLPRADQAVALHEAQWTATAVDGAFDESQPEGIAVVV